MWKLSFLILLFFFSCADEVIKVNAQKSIPETTTSEQSPESQDTVSPYDDYGFEMLLGRFEPSKHEDYQLIDRKYADREGMYIHKDTYAAFIKMHEAAMQDNVDLVIRSATRNFDYQKGIWERKWNGESKVDGENLSLTIKDPQTRALKILEYSSMPGTSRHHWGSDIDLNSFNNEWFETGKGRKLWDWLEENASAYGFCRPYTKKGSERPDGYQEERWHWSYMPLSTYFMSMAEEKHADSEIQGFMGAEVADEINVVKKYVFGVNHVCNSRKE